MNKLGGEKNPVHRLLGIQLFDNLGNIFFFRLHCRSNKIKTNLTAEQSENLHGGDEKVIKHQTLHKV